MKKIETKTAQNYIKNYEIKMKELGVDTPAKGFTESVSFEKVELQEWMQTLGSDTKQIKIFFGVYPSHPKKIIQRLSSEESEGRFTTILWPCNAQGDPADDDEGNEEAPVNVGELHP